MSEPQKSGVWAAAVLAVILAIPPGYLLLLGPMFRLVAVGTLTLEDWEVIATPAIYVSGLMGGEPDLFWGTYDRYIEWWAPGP